MSEADMREIDEFCGRFHGHGTWRDSAGNTDDYEAFLSIRVTDDGLEINQKHVHDGAASELAFTLTTVTPCIYRVDAPGQDGGFGFSMNDELRFHFNNHIGSLTDIGYRTKPPGSLVAYGYTDRNSDGNYIMWHEELQRVAE